MKTENMLRFGRKGIQQMCLGLLAAGSLLTACVDEVSLADESATVELEATPVKGQGLKLEARVTNPALKVEKSGFRVDNSFDWYQHSDHPSSTRDYHCVVELPGQTSFSTVLAPQEEWVTDFRGYAYVVVKGKEYRSSYVSAVLGPDDMELHVPKVATVKASNARGYRGSVRGTFEVTGEGFYGHASLSTHRSYIEFNMSGGNFNFDYGEWNMKLTPTRITLPFTADAFDTFNLLAIRQGEKYYPVDLSVTLIPDAHLAAPSYGLRAGEFVDMHERLSEPNGYSWQKVDSLEVDHGQSVGVTNLNDIGKGNLFAVISDRDEVNCKQYIDQTFINEPLVIKMSHPWEECGQLSSVPALPQDRVSTAGAMWYVKDYDLCRFDPKTGEETRYALPFHASPKEVVRVGKDDQGGLLVCHNCNNKTGRDWIYAFNPASTEFESLGYVSPHTYFDSKDWELLFLAREGNKVYLVHRITNSLHCFTRFNAEYNSVEKRCFDSTPNSFYKWHFVGLRNGKLFAVLNLGLLYSAEMQDIFQSVDYTRKNRMPISFDRGFFYDPDFVEQSGHYLYVGNTPVARYDLDKPGCPIEYLGCPRGAYYDLDVLTIDGDDCKVLEKTTGKTWAFKEER